MKVVKKLNEIKFTLKQARVYKGVSQGEVANVLKVHRQTYMKWEERPDLMPIGKALLFSEFVGRKPSELIFLA